MRAVLIAAVTLTGCLPIASDGDCRDVSDCTDGELCTDIRECATAEAAPPWRVSWTVNGTSVSASEPGGCDRVSHLELTITSGDDAVSYTPVGCTNGLFDFRALPLRFDRARIEVYDGAGERVDRTSATGDRSESSEVIVGLSVP